MSHKRYEFTGETKVASITTLKRIRALVDIPEIGVQAGDLGGWIEKEENLLQVFGSAWVYGNAQVYGNARVNGNAWVYGDARVSGNAWVHGDAQVYGNAWVSGDARVSGNAWVYGDARVNGDAWVYGDARVKHKIIIATRSDGYTFLITPTQNGPPVIIARYRYFTITEAREHWTKTRAGTLLGDESLALVDHLERMAKLQKWID